MFAKKTLFFCFFVFIFFNFTLAGEIFSSDDTRIFFSGRMAMVTAENVNGDKVITDNSSRFRFDVHKILDEDIKIIATSEYSVMANASNSEDLFKNRLGYVGISGDFGRISVGRVWNAAYNVASWTDFDELYGNDTLLGISNYNNTDLQGLIRTTDTIKYENNNFYGFTIAVQYSGPLKNNINISLPESETPVNLKFNRNYAVAGSIIYNVNEFIAIGYAYSSSSAERKDDATTTPPTESTIDNFSVTQHIMGFIYNNKRIRFASTIGYELDKLYFENNANSDNIYNETHFSYNYDKDPINHSIISASVFYSVRDNLHDVNYFFATLAVTKALNKDVYVYVEASRSLRKEESAVSLLFTPPKNQFLLGFRFSW